MKEIFTFLWLAACVFTFISFFKPTPPYNTRLRTVFLGVPLMFLLLFTLSIYFPLDDEPSRNEVRVANNTKPTVSTSEKQGGQPVKKQVLVKDWEKAGFPSKFSYFHASQINISNYSVYRMLYDQQAIDRHCEWEADDLAIIFEADKRFGLHAMGENYKKKSAWITKQQEELDAKFTKDTKQTELEQTQLMIHGSWKVRCAAKQIGWKVADRADAGNVSDDNVRDIREALFLLYINQLKKGSHPYFDKSLYSVADCEQNMVGSLHVIGCRLIDYGRETKFDYYIAARSKTGGLVAAATHQKTHIVEVGQKIIYTADGGKVYLGRMADPVFDPISSEYDMSETKKAFGVK